VNSVVRNWIARLRSPGRPDEGEVKELLAACGIRVPAGQRLSADAALAEPALRYPLVVKVCAPNVLHKTDVGALAIGVGRDSLANVVTRLRDRFPGRDLLIEEHVAFEPPELIVGALLDGDFGAAVMVGAGGILAEVYRDTAFRLAPCPAGEARHMIRELRLAPVFEGARGARLDEDALAAVVSQVADLAATFGDRLSQLDINPIVCTPDGWVALDAAMILSPTVIQHAPAASRGA